MFTAIAALIGVVLGSAASGTVQFLLERARTRNTQQVAARLLLDELVWIHSVVGTWIGQPKAFEQASAKDHNNLSKCWDQHRSILASAISIKERRVLAAGVRQF
jgi:hypothetical protein